MRCNYTYIGKIKEMSKEEQYLEALERINEAYDKSGLKAKYSKEMRSALTNMKLTLLLIQNNNLERNERNIHKNTVYTDNRHTRANNYWGGVLYNRDDMTKAEEIFERHIGLNAEMGYLPIKKEDVLDAINEALAISHSTQQNEMCCDCLPMSTQVSTINGRYICCTCNKPLLPLNKSY